MTWLAFLAVVACEDPATEEEGQEAARGRVVDALLPDALPDVMGAPCRLNSDCDPGFYCHPERGCAFDCRIDRDCPPGTRCESGECNAPPVVVDAAPPDCEGDDGCMPPHTICVRGVCVSGCVIRGCEGEDEARCDEVTGRCVAQCDPPCPPGHQCDGEGVCAPVPSACRDADCPDGERCGEDGQCVPEDVECRDADCPAGERCGEDGECAPVGVDCRDADCPDGQACGPDGRCTPQAADCRADGCLDGEVCDEETGACEPAGGDSALGADCMRAADCDSDVCIEVGNRGVVCTRPCCGEADCPIGFGCLYVGGLRLCLPSRIFPAGFDFNASVNQPCGVGGRACRSGLCDVRADRCLGACCTDRECFAGEACRWVTAGESIRAVCELPLLGDGRTGAPCGSEFDCRSGVCIPVPGGNHGFPGSCADMCCTHGDCPAGSGCGQVVAFEGTVTSACVPLVPGPAPDDARCGIGDACASGLCADGQCRQPCCRDEDCPQPRRCLPRINGEGTFVRACVPPD